MPYTVRHVVTTRNFLPSIVAEARAEIALVDRAVDGEWDPTKDTLTFNMELDDLRTLAAMIAGTRYATARFDAISYRRDIAPRDVCVYFLGESGEVLCASTAEDDPRTVTNELDRVAERIESLREVQTSLVQRGHDLGLTDRRLGGFAKLSHPKIAALHRGQRPAHRVEGDALRVLRAAGIATDESVRVYNTVAIHEINDFNAARTWVPSVRIVAHFDGELRLVTGSYQTMDQARDCVALTRRAADLLGSVPGMEVELKHMETHAQGSEKVELPVYTISYVAPPE